MNNLSKINYKYMVKLTIYQKMFWAMGVVRWLRLDRHMGVLARVAQAFRINSSILKFLGFLSVYLWIVTGCLKHEFEKDNEVGLYHLVSKVVDDVLVIMIITQIERLGKSWKGKIATGKNCFLSNFPEPGHPQIFPDRVGLDVGDACGAVRQLATCPVHDNRELSPGVYDLDHHGGDDYSDCHYC